MEHYGNPNTARCRLPDPLLNELACTVRAAPGDAVYYSNRVWHRSQDGIRDREALSFDVASAEKVSSAR